jgi:phosphocarrier protein HPr
VSALTIQESFPDMSDPQPGSEDECIGKPVAGPPGTLIQVFKIINQKGLHARASAKFVQTVEKFDADVRVSRCGETVGGTSIMGLMMLAAGFGTTITVTASGPQGPEVLKALEGLLNSRFGEDD